MKMQAKKVAVIEMEGEGLLALLGKRVFIMSARHFYTGTLAGVNDQCILLEDAKIVYETGAFNSPKMKNAQALPGPWYVSVGGIESFGELPDGVLM